MPNNQKFVDIILEVNLILLILDEQIEQLLKQAEKNDQTPKQFFPTLINEFTKCFDEIKKINLALGWLIEGCNIKRLYYQLETIKGCSEEKEECQAIIKTAYDELFKLYNEDKNDFELLNEAMNELSIENVLYKLSQDVSPYLKMQFICDQLVILTHCSVLTKSIAKTPEEELQLIRSMLTLLPNIQSQLKEIHNSSSEPTSRITVDINAAEQILALYKTYEEDIDSNPDVFSSLNMVIANRNALIKKDDSISSEEYERFYENSKKYNISIFLSSIFDKKPALFIKSLCKIAYPKQTKNKCEDNTTTHKMKINKPSPDENRRYLVARRLKPRSHDGQTLALLENYLANHEVTSGFSGLTVEQPEEEDDQPKRPVKKRHLDSTSTLFSSSGNKGDEMSSTSVGSDDDSMRKKPF